MKIVLNPQYECLRDYIETIPQIFNSHGELIYKARNQIKEFTLPDGRQINVKRYGVPVFINRFVYRFFRKPKAERAYMYGLKLQKAGIKTATPIAYMIEYIYGQLAYSYLVTEQITAFRMLYEFGEHPLLGYENVIIALARFTADLHNKGIYHKDYSPGNILWNIVDGKPQFILIDINRMDFGSVSLQKGCRNFKRLWGNPEMMRLIACEYALARGFDISTCEKLILKEWQSFWKNNHPIFQLYD